MANRIVSNLGFLVVSLFVLGRGDPSLAAPPLRLEIHGQSLVASRAQGKVVFFGVSRQIDPDEIVTRRRLAELRADEDGDGVVTLALDRPVAPVSVWAAVDLASGDVAVVSPTGSRTPRGGFRGRGLGHRETGRGTVHDLRFQSELLVVRPGVGGGAWTLTAGDGNVGDEDGDANGELETALDRMTPLDASPAPPEDFGPGDVVLLVDPRSLEVVLVRQPGGAK
ncbi:MAG: hypothetical protein ABJC13_06385 [Acidobacteriota bacterium]